MALKGDGPMQRVAELLDRVAALEKDNATLQSEVDATRASEKEAHDELAGYQIAVLIDQWMIQQLGTLHEFIADVRLGIRDLSEYEEVCRRAGLVA